ncbi:hypothetical protein V1478_004732 [Vespula squamosa]|uniref:Uncharacterized protein n=1 Tax=Vespula squamosa TaxID=30214 RepID=A0ABD2BHE2_VESSQ
MNSFYTCYLHVRSEYIGVTDVTIWNYHGNYSNQYDFGTIVILICQVNSGCIKCIHITFTINVSYFGIIYSKAQT